MRVLSIFSGIGGFDLAAEWVGFKVVGQVENNAFCISVLEKHWPNVKRIKDIKDVKGDEFGSIDLLCGGPPCQPASCAGKRRGTEDDRWLWDETLRVAKIIKPRWCLFENPTGILSLQGGVPFEHLLLNLEAQGFSVQTVILPACAVNAPHRRDRVWIVGYSPRERFQDGGGPSVGQSEKEQKPKRSNSERSRLQRSQDVADTQGGQSREQTEPEGRKDIGRGSEEGGIMGNTNIPRKKSIATASRSWDSTCQSSWWSTEPDVGGTFNGLPTGLDGHLWTDGWEVGVPRVARGIPNRVNRLKALGNSIVWLVVVPILQAIKEIDDGIKANTSL